MIGMLRLVALVFSFLVRHAKNADGSKSAVASCLCCCTLCCKDCVKDLLRLTNEMVYVEIAINGTSYTEGQWEVQNLITSYPSSVALSHSITRAIRCLGTMVIGIGGTFLAHLTL